MTFWEIFTLLKYKKRAWALFFNCMNKFIVSSKLVLSVLSEHIKFIGWSTNSLYSYP